MTTSQQQSRRPTTSNCVEQIGILVEPAEVSVVHVGQPLPYRRYFTDALILCTMALGLELFGRFYGPHRRVIWSFYCTDESIRLPFKPNSVNILELIVYALIVNFVTVFIIEGYRLQKPELADEFYSKYEHGRTRIGRLIVRVAIFFGYSTACILIIWTLTTATKYPIGRLRPHFMDVCRPSVGYLTCNTTEYITNYVCTTDFLLLIQESRLSFFSGHSSIALSTATFFCFYTQDRLAGQVGSRVLVPVLQTLQLSITLFISYTRILDNWHHYTDVLTGCLVGIVVTGVLCKYFIGLVPKVQPRVLDERSHLLRRVSTNSTNGLSCTPCKQNSTNSHSHQANLIGTTF